MKWTRVEKHWQELASKANAAERNARLKAIPESEPSAELGMQAPEPAVDTDPLAPLGDVQATDESDAGTDSARDTD